MSAIDYYLLKKNLLDEARVLLNNYKDLSRGLHKLGAPSATSLSATGGYAITPLTIRLWNAESTRAGDAVFWLLDPNPSKAVYIKARVRTNDTIEVGVSDGSLSNRYGARVYLPGSTADFVLIKVVSDTMTELATESVDLSADTIYTVEFLWDKEHGMLYAWRDGELKLTARDTELTTLNYLSIVEASTGGYGEAIFPVVVAWE